MTDKKKVEVYTIHLEGILIGADREAIGKWIMEQIEKRPK